MEADLRVVPREFRIVVFLADVEGLSYQEVADRLGIPHGTVTSRLHRGRRRLRSLLTDHARAHGVPAVRPGSCRSVLGERE